MFKNPEIVGDQVSNRDGIDRKDVLEPACIIKEVDVKGDIDSLNTDQESEVNKISYS